MLFFLAIISIYRKHFTSHSQTLAVDMSQHAIHRRSRCFAAKWMLFRAFRAALAPDRNSRKSKRREIRAARILHWKTAPLSRGIRFIAIGRALLSGSTRCSSGSRSISRPRISVSVENFFN